MAIANPLLQAALKKPRQTLANRYGPKTPIWDSNKAQGLGVLPGMPGSPTHQPDANVAPTVLPTDPTYQTDINNAITTYNDTYTGLQDAIQNAALAYGDPTAMAAYGVKETANPNSALAIAARNALRTSNTDAARRLGNGTALSSLATNDANLISQNQQTADTAAQGKFNTAVQNYNLKSTQAKDTEQGQINADLAAEAKEATANLPTQTPTPTVGTPTTQTTTKVGKTGTGGVTTVKKAPNTSVLTKIRLPNGKMP